VVEYLTYRPQGAASQYAHEHPPNLPYFAELDNVARGSTTALPGEPPVATTVLASGNPLVSDETHEVIMTANVDTELLVEVLPTTLNDPDPGSHAGLGLPTNAPPTKP
jgi:hypothetical protein